MKPGRLIPLTLSLSILGFSLLHAANPGEASDLTGKRLKAAFSWRSITLVALSGGNGSIAKVLVRQDSPDCLSLETSYTGLSSEGPFHLAARATDKKYNPFTAIAEATVEVSGTEGTAEVVLQFDPTFPTGTTVDQTHLVVEIGDPGAVQKEAVGVFDCKKRWLKLQDTATSVESTSSEGIETTGGGEGASPAVTDAAVPAVGTPIVFRTLTPLAESGAAVLVAEVVSSRFDPNGAIEMTLSMELTQDHATFAAGPIYQTGSAYSQPGPREVLFRYRLLLVRPDGTTVEGTNWIDSHGATVYVGSAQVRQSLGEFSATPPPQSVTPGRRLTIRSSQR